MKNEKTILRKLSEALAATARQDGTNVAMIPPAVRSLMIREFYQKYCQDLPLVEREQLLDEAGLLRVEHPGESALLKHKWQNGHRARAVEKNDPEARGAFLREELIYRLAGMPHQEAAGFVNSTEGEQEAPVN